MLVSAVIPTRERPAMAEAALRCCLLQDYPDLEILILDDEDNPSFHVVPSDTRVNYMRGSRMKIGPKRNSLCEASRGDIIVHFDSDDWSAPGRLSEQVHNLEQSGKLVTGYNSMLFWDCDKVLGFKYKGVGDYSLGSALCYRKQFWRAHPFITETNDRYEDNAFVQKAREENQIVSVDGGKTMVARIHAGNTSPKSPLEAPQQWPPVPTSEFPAEFFRAIAVEDVQMRSHLSGGKRDEA